MNVVDIPILLLSAEMDQYTPVFHSEVILSGVQNNKKVHHRVIKNDSEFRKSESMSISEHLDVKLEVSSRFIIGNIEFISVR